MKCSKNLNFASRIVISKMEERYYLITGNAICCKYSLKRKLPIFQIQNTTPQEAAYNIYNTIKIKFIGCSFFFMYSLLHKISDNNFMIFEFVENWNKKEKSNMGYGFFMEKNAVFGIVKRKNKNIKEQIFNILHLLGMYLLNLKGDCNLMQKSWIKLFSLYYLRFCGFYNIIK